MTSSAATPSPEQFTLVRRGYAPNEVDTRLAELQRDLRAALGEQRAVAQTIADLTAELDEARARTASLTEDLDRQASQPLTMSALSSRMQRLLEIAEEESAEVRAAADRYSSEIRDQAATEAIRLRQDAETETQRQRRETEAYVTQMRADLEAEVARTRAELQDDRAEVDRTRTAVYEQAKRLMTEAHTDAERTLAEARAQAEHLSATAAADRAKQEEDYELAIETRRRQSHRAIIEAEESCRADAQHRVEQATAHARAIVDSATAHAEDLLSRAATESHERVTEADEAVRRLVEVRADLQQQILDLGGSLTDLNDMMSTVRKTLEPLSIESGRPRADAFPADPTQRAAGSPRPLAAVLPQWNPPTAPVSRAWERVSAQLENAGDEQPTDDTVADDTVMEQPPDDAVAAVQDTVDEQDAVDEQAADRA